MILKTINARSVNCPLQEVEVRLKQCEACRHFETINNTFTELTCSYLQFAKALEVKLIAKDLIEKYHPRLVEARIEYLYRYGSWAVKGKTKLGNAEKASGKIKHITGFDFIVMVNGDAWSSLSTEQQEAVVDHELCHCDRNGNDADGKPIWTIRPHDVEDFAEVVNRHGIWTNDVKKMATAIEVSNYRQMTLIPGREDPHNPNLRAVQ